MKFLFLSLLLSILMLTAGCAPEPEPAIDQAAVVARHASVRMSNSSTSRTLTTLQPGDKVDVLERQDNWYRIRIGYMEGWMEESTIVTDTALAHIEKLVAESLGQAAQNTAVVREPVNFRVEPGRSTSIIRRLPEGARVEVLDRVTLPRQEADGPLDVWLKVRVSPTEVGWLFSSLVDFDVPAEIARYTEGYVYAAVKPLNVVQDSVEGPVYWYVVGERRAGLDPHLDFSGIRVYTWNLRMHRYETAFRIRDIRGVYPLEVGQQGASPTFRIYELAADGTTKSPRDFVMQGVIAREVRQAPQP